MLKDSMKAVVTTGTGDYDQLVYKSVPMPTISGREVLIKVLAAGINNTEINTRLGWYSESVSDSTQDTAAIDGSDGGWNKQTPFPFIQGTDCCGLVVETASEKDRHLLGKRVLVRPCIREYGFDSLDNLWFGSDFNGAFAQYSAVASSEVFVIDSHWSDAELGGIPCAYGTSENMLHRANLQAGQTVLISGASGGVGSATVQLAKRRGANVIAIVSGDKKAAVSALGANQVFDRNDNLLAELDEQSIDLVVDNVAGDNFPCMLKLLKRGGKLVSSGAIAGPLVQLDMRDMYLKDIQLIGSTAWDEPVFANLIGYIERGEIKPALAKRFALQDIVEAQQSFLQKKHVGKIVLIPEHMD